MLRPFDQTLNYSSVNEDWDAELRALRLGSDGPVLCVTGSGARPLALLARAEVDVVAIDVNPAQNHLLRLQLAAMEALALSDWPGWIGARPADPGWRLQAYRQRIAPRLLPATRQWFDHRQPLLAHGLVYAGRWERHFRRVSRVARRIWPVDELFAFDDLDDQREWLREHWSSPRWQAAWRLVCHPWVSRLALRDPAFQGRLDVPPGRYLQHRMRQCLETRLARDSFMVSLVLRGTLAPRDMPPHLTPGGAAAIRERRHRLTIIDDDVAAHLRGGSRGAYTRFSLSDLPSYLDPAHAEMLWREVVRAAAPGARVVVREFLRRHPVPADLPLRRDTALEASLARHDRSFAYDFIIADVPGQP